MLLNEMGKRAASLAASCFLGAPIDRLMFPIVCTAVEVG
jgi:hypothetical protein